MCSYFCALSTILAALFLIVLQSLDVLAGEPTGKCVPVIQSGGEKAVDEVLSISQGECGMKSGDVPQVKK